MRRATPIRTWANDEKVSFQVSGGMGYASSPWNIQMRCVPPQAAVRFCRTPGSRRGPDMVVFRGRGSAACVCMALAVVGCAGPAGGRMEVEARAKMLTLDNGILSVRYDTGAGTFTAARGDRLFITEGRLTAPGRETAPEVRIADTRDALGKGKSIEVTWPDGHGTRMTLYDSLPLLCVKGSFRNAAEQPKTLEHIAPLSVTLDAGAPVSALRGFGPEGLFGLGRRTCFCFAAAVNPTTRAGVVCGWLTHNRGSGVVALDAGGGTLTLGARAEYGRLVVPADTMAEGETVAIGYFDDALEGLEAYGAACGKANEVSLPAKAPSGYCTWYHARALNQARAAELAAFCGKHLKQFGLDFIQIDDGWQVGGRDFTTHRPGGPYPDGMKPTAEKIASQGLTAGIWYIPFGWDPKCRSLRDHADWFVKRPDGSIYAVRWAGSCLDMTHPEAREFLRGVVARMSRDWGYKYMKIDGLWSGMAVKILYPSPSYRPDELGQAVLHDPAQTQVEAYRSGLKLVREAAGKDVFLLGCNIAQNARTLGASFGLVDGMRIGHDIGARWGSIRGCAQPMARFYFLHDKVWFNDPDCLMLRAPLTLDQARAWGSVLAISGQMNVVSEWLPGLPAEKLDVVKRTMPNHGGLGRPLDLFESNPPRIWHYRTEVGGERLDVVALVNWGEGKPFDIELDVARLGLPASPEDRYVGFDYWEGVFVPPFAGKRTFRLRPSSCRVIALARLAARPQLVSTSRHVTQGAVDVVELGWDARTRTLTGRSKVVGEDPYELRVTVPRVDGKSFRLAEAGLSEADANAGVKARVSQAGPCVRVTLESRESREVAWHLTFESVRAKHDEPLKVTALRAEAASPCGVALTWEGAGAALYRVSRSDGPTIEIGQPEYADADVAPDTAYTYTVVAIGWDGKESAEAAVSVRTPAPPPPPPPPDVHISDLKPLKATVGWGGPAKPDRSIGRRPLSIAGTRYEKGMGVHAPSELVYGLEPGYVRFVAVVGIDDEKRDDPRASVVFEVYADKKRLARSPIMRPAAVWFMNAAIPAGSKRLRLIVTDAGDGIACDHADWANAGFIRGK